MAILLVAWAGYMQTILSLIQLPQIFQFVFIPFIMKTVTRRRPCVLQEKIRTFERNGAKKWRKNLKNREEWRKI